MIHYPIIPNNTVMGYNLREVIYMVILESRNERVRLLKKGFTGKQIEMLYVILNSLDVISVDWQEFEK
ncbi:MAG: hypothetical protein MPEBLZ_01367 [Candidatus Methanoperedens nitroreducens]|uniref:Uncharacterized protein n=1 Tax=Candidatus Methanoperedens nitratireducens TaxID=1392998 RepID=A0A0P8CB76_9EURY|nr:MAG: hypothetical protein MPEBLZ_01367 [Candidatus Methanoperedens sp. BLZ1]CAG0978344.1 hypothetical protein METP2_01812 [Methanosarcinales archaeon]